MPPKAARQPTAKLPALKDQRFLVFSPASVDALIVGTKKKTQPLWDMVAEVFPPRNTPRTYVVHYEPHFGTAHNRQIWMDYTEQHAGDVNTGAMRHLGWESIIRGPVVILWDLE